MYSNKRLTLYIALRGGSKMERFVIIVNGFQPLAIITKRSNLNVAAVLDPSLQFPIWNLNMYVAIKLIKYMSFDPLQAGKVAKGVVHDIAFKQAIYCFRYVLYFSTEIHKT